MNEKLANILNEARKNNELKEKLLKTKTDKDPMDEFCRVVSEYGFDLSVGELFEIGEEFTSNLLKSVNGGAVYPMDSWDDWYEDFFAAL
ncbi:MAG: Nif11-like leader peptide family natural product precursor [Peptostreptococcaceae bacterium]